MCRVKWLLSCLVFVVYLLLAAAFSQVKGQVFGATQSLKGGKTMTQVDDPMVPVPIPQQVSAKEGIAQLPGTRLGYWDTGGNGTPVVLLHPASGSALVWCTSSPYSPMPAIASSPIRAGTITTPSWRRRTIRESLRRICIT